MFTFIGEDSFLFRAASRARCALYFAGSFFNLISFNFFRDLSSFFASSLPILCSFFSLYLFYFSALVSLTSPKDFLPILDEDGQ